MKRRRAVVLGGLGVAVLLLAGAFAATTLLGGEPSAAQQVPGGVDAVVRVDMAITDDRATRAIAAAGVERVPLLGAAPTNVSLLLAQFETRTGLHPADADEVVAFGWRGDDTTVDAAGVVVHGDWSEAAVREAVTANGSRNLTATTYAGQRVYRPSDGGPWLGVVGDGQFVLGSQRAVERTLDVTAGDADAFGGQLRAAYDATDPGLVTVAARVPTERVPDSAGRAVDLTRYRQVAVVAGRYDTSETGVTVAVRLRTNSTEAARDVADVTAGALALARGTAGNETVAEHLRAVEVEREDQTVVLTYERSVSAVEALVRYYAGGEASATLAGPRAPTLGATAPSAVGSGPHSVAGGEPR